MLPIFPFPSTHTRRFLTPHKHLYALAQRHAMSHREKTVPFRLEAWRRKWTEKNSFCAVDIHTKKQQQQSEEENVIFFEWWRREEKNLWPIQSFLFLVLKHETATTMRLLQLCVYIIDPGGISSLENKSRKYTQEHVYFEKKFFTFTFLLCVLWLHLGWSERVNEGVDGTQILNIFFTRNAFFHMEQQEAWIQLECARTFPSAQIKKVFLLSSDLNQ